MMVVFFYDIEKSFGISSIIKILRGDAHFILLEMIYNLIYLQEMFQRNCYTNIHLVYR